MFAQSSGEVPKSTRFFNEDCARVEKVAFHYLEDRGIELSTTNATQDFERLGGKIDPSMKSRPGRYFLELQLPSAARRRRTSRLQDARGNPIGGTRQAMDLYTQYETYKQPFGTWITYDSFHLSGGVVDFVSDKGGCHVTLAHHYVVTGIQWMFFFPVDGDPVSLSSNGRLESEYLAEIDRRLNAH
jgi:hypothetical protein